jgi:formylglycine-generating enzyme required for sulfatase activity
MSAPDPKVMAPVPAGAFEMGDPLGDGNANELPLHAVEVSAFYMDRFLVTKAAWDGVYAWAVRHGYEFENEGWGNAADHSVETVNWYAKNSFRVMRGGAWHRGEKFCRCAHRGMDAPDLGWITFGFRCVRAA